MTKHKVIVLKIIAQQLTITEAATSTASSPATASTDSTLASFLPNTDEHGIPASTLTDNGRVDTARFDGGRNAFEHLLPLLGT